MKMRTILQTLFFLLIIGILLFINSANAQTSTETGLTVETDSRLKPLNIGVGVNLGLVRSILIASPEYNALIRPTPAENKYWLAPSLGLMLSARWKRGITLTFAPRRESYGAETKEGIVSFPGNPFPHSLKAKTQLTYNVYPILLGMGWFSSRQHFQIQLGTYAAYLDKPSISWTVDGEPYTAIPEVQYRWTQAGALLGLEYGRSLSHGELLLGIEANRQAHSLAGGLSGTIKAESVRLSAGYLWKFKL